MKKVLLLLAVVALVSATGSVSSNSAKFQNAVTIGPGVPEEVTATFDQLITNIMEVNFPGNSNYNANGVSWDKNKNEWHCNGVVQQANGTGSVEVVFGNFQNSGEFIEFFYHVHQ